MIFIQSGLLLIINQLHSSITSIIHSQRSIIHNHYLLSYLLILQALLLNFMSLEIVKETKKFVLTNTNYNIDIYVFISSLQLSLLFFVQRSIALLTFAAKSFWIIFLLVSIVNIDLPLTGNYKTQQMLNTIKT